MNRDPIQHSHTFGPPDLDPGPVPARALTDGEVLAKLGTDGLLWARGLADALTNQALGGRLDVILDPEGGGLLHVWITNAIEAGRAAGYSAGLAAAGIALGSPTPVPLADADPQFTATTTIDGEVIGREAITHPFTVTTVKVDPRDFPTDGSPLRLVVDVSGIRAAIRHVMRPIDLTPNDERPGPASGHDLAALDGEPWPDPAPTDSELAPERVRDFLLIVGHQPMPDLATIATWPPAARRKVVQWAAAVHLSASDNDNDVPARPEVLG